MARETKTYTAVVTERDTPLPPASPWPLIYTVELTDPQDESAALRQIADIRYDELDCEDSDDGTQNSDTIDAICSGLELHFLFEGDIPTAADFRG